MSWSSSVTRIIASFLVAFVVAAFSSEAAASPLHEVATRATPSVVLLTISDRGGRKIGSGTGFFIAADGKIVTNHHVIDAAASVTATLPDGRTIEGIKLLVEDEENDLAILRAPGDGYPALPLGDSSALRPGDEVVVLGSPLGLSVTLSTGIVSAIRDASSKALEEFEANDPHPTRRHSKSWRVQVSAPISPGSSGSPVMNSKGEVVAVAVGNLSGGQSLNFAIPSDEVKALLARAGSEGKAFRAASKNEVLRNLAISAAFFASIALVSFAFRRYAKYKDAARGRVRISTAWRN